MTGVLQAPPQFGPSGTCEWSADSMMLGPNGIQTSMLDTEVGNLCKE